MDTKHLGVCSVSGRSRVPKPAASSRARSGFINARSAFIFVIDIPFLRQIPAERRQASAPRTEHSHYYTSMIRSAKAKLAVNAGEIAFSTWVLAGPGRQRKSSPRRWLVWLNSWERMPILFSSSIFHKVLVNFNDLSISLCPITSNLVFIKIFCNFCLI